MSHCPDGPQFIYLLSTEWHLGCLQASAVMNKAAINIRVWTFVPTEAFNALILKLRYFALKTNILIGPLAFLENRKIWCLLLQSSKCGSWPPVGLEISTLSQPWLPLCSWSEVSRHVSLRSLEGCGERCVCYLSSGTVESAL